MAETKTAVHASIDKNHPSKKALDKYGGDPLAPNDVVLERIAKVVKGGKEDDLVDRWADAVLHLWDEQNKPIYGDINHPNTPKRILLHKIASYVADKKMEESAEDEVKEWA